MSVPKCKQVHVLAEDQTIFTEIATKIGTLYPITKAPDKTEYLMSVSEIFL